MFGFDIMISQKYIYYAKWFCADLLSDKSLNPEVAQKNHAEGRAVYGQFSNCMHAYR